ncbi:UNVERIFIED_CONTAM: hypothetical protein GTU68_057523 [Idotea baltica]|nr:hypothetical protein [Idotea baltica]
MSKLKILGNSIYFGFLAIILYGCYHDYFTWCSTIYSICFASFLRFVFLPADCDMILQYYEYFGKNVDSLNGEVIWITGASSGIGEALALTLAKGKVKLALSARSEDLLHKVKERCIEIGNLDSEDVLVVPLDMTDYDKHESAFSTVLKHFGKVSSANRSAYGPQRAQWERIETSVDEALFYVNTFGLLRLARRATLHFVSVGGGSHVVMSSVAGRMGVPMSASYTGSKHALMVSFLCFFFVCVCGGVVGTNMCVCVCNI